MYGEGAAAPGRALDSDFSLVCRGDMPDNREAQACAAEVSAARFIYTIEPLEKARNVFGRNPHAVVSNTNHYFFPNLFCFDAHFLVRTTVLDGIVDEVRHSLFDKLGVCTNLQRIRAVYDEFNVLLFSLGIAERKDCLHNL